MMRSKGATLDFMKHSHMTTKRPISARAAVFPGPEARGSERSPIRGHMASVPWHTAPVRSAEHQAELGCCQDLVTPEYLSTTVVVV